MSSGPGASEGLAFVGLVRARFAATHPRRTRALSLSRHLVGAVLIAMSRATRILFCGDPHGRFEHILRAAAELKPIAVILLGDLQPRRPLQQELAPILDLVYFVHGNHDTDSVEDFENLFDSDLAHRNISGQVVTLADGTRIAGLGGVFRETVWAPPAPPRYESAEQHARASSLHDQWRGGPSRKHWSSIYPKQYDRLVLESADVLVTHEAPSCHPLGYAVIDELAQALGAKKVFHGHHHDRLDYKRFWSSQGFQTHGVGLAGITDQHGVVVQPGEVDHVKQFRQRRVDDDRWQGGS